MKKKVEQSSPTGNTALPDGSAWDYGYDDLGQLTSAQRDSINAMAYAYDTIGNRQTATEDGTSTAYTANDLNQYTAVNSEIPTYDADGNLLTNAGWTYTWNAENRLIRAENGSVRIEANYDYLGRRFEKKVFYGNTLTQHQYFIYDGYKLAAILDALNDGQITTTFTWQPTGPDTPLTMTHKGETGYYLTDGNKNVLKVLRSDGTELATYTYSPFGQLLSMTGPWGQLNPFRFSSEYHDNETGLVYYNYRHYSPKLGRWLSRDPIGESGGENLYGITGNNLILLFDHLGYSWWEVIPIIGTVISHINANSVFGSSHSDYYKFRITNAQCCEAQRIDYAAVEALEKKCRDDVSALALSAIYDVAGPGVVRFGIDAGTGIYSVKDDKNIQGLVFFMDGIASAAATLRAVNAIRAATKLAYQLYCDCNR